MTDEARTTEDRMAAGIYFFRAAARLCSLAHHANMAEAYNNPDDEACEHVQAACFQATEQAEEQVQAAWKHAPEHRKDWALDVLVAGARCSSEDMDNEKAAEDFANIAAQCERIAEELQERVAEMIRHREMMK